MVNLFLVSWRAFSFLTILVRAWSTVNVIGIANATSAGWGNFGGGVALLLNSAIFRAWKSYEYNNEMAWRATLAWSPAALFLSGIFCFLFSDDCPYGNFHE